MSVRDSLRRLRENDPIALADNKPHARQLDGIPEDLSPSEMKQLTEQIKRRRLTGDGLSRDEVKGVMQRIGYGRKK